MHMSTPSAVMQTHQYMYYTAAPQIAAPQYQSEQLLIYALQFQTPSSGLHQQTEHYQMPQSNTNMGDLTQIQSMLGRLESKLETVH